MFKKYILISTFVLYEMFILFYLCTVPFGVVQHLQLPTVSAV